MTLPEFLADPTARDTALAVGLSAFSTIHTFLGKHPRAQAALKALAHVAGPLNLPALKEAGIEFCRAVVAYEDGDHDAPIQVGNPLLRAALDAADAAMKMHPLEPKPTQPIPVAQVTSSPGGTVAKW